MKEKDKILKANDIDIKENKSKLNAALLDRLILDEKRIELICNRCENF